MTNGKAFQLFQESQSQLYSECFLGDVTGHFRKERVQCSRKLLSCSLWIQYLLAQVKSPNILTKSYFCLTWCFLSLFERRIFFFDKEASNTYSLLPRCCMSKDFIWYIDLTQIPSSEINIQKFHQVADAKDTKYSRTIHSFNHIFIGLANSQQFLQIYSSIQKIRSWREEIIGDIRQ